MTNGFRQAKKQLPAAILIRIGRTIKVDNVSTREAGRTELYNLLCKELNGENKLHKVKLKPEKWQQFQNGQHLNGKTDFFGKIISLEGLSEENLK